MGGDGVSNNGYRALNGAGEVEDVLPHGNGVSLFGVTANLITAGLGVGILSLPWAMAGASLFPSVVITILVMAINAATIMILVSAAERYQAFDLGALLGHLPGRWGASLQVVCNIMTAASVFLCLTGILVVIADSIAPFAAPLAGIKESELDSDETWWRLRLPLLFVGAIFALPLCFMDQRHLSFSSSLGIAVNIYLFVVLIALLKDNGPAPECCLMGAGSGIITMFSSLMQCAVIQMCVLPMYEDMQNRTPKRFFTAVAIAFVFLAVLFATFASAAYLLYGSTVHANVIQDFPKDLHGTVARVGLVLAVLAVYPLLAVSVVAPVRHWEEGQHHRTRWASRAVTVALVILSAFGGTAVSQLGPLNELNGALQVSCFIGLAPGFAGLYLVGKETALWRFSMYLLVLCAMIASASGFFYTANSVAEITASGCWWVLGAQSL
mmetsp:Transcript_62245/g.131573  ORF Transcript_62245/g.131573 Transcript_62245/m.131573 type:complete len:439 (-) Transcript_62245:720-2036(-)|eukprot:CAMPEP_0206456210 /NCGR_PEP_ID=MMETSP0324_2-20121206/22229_1 /ASSEMBLY_ACC=CAM_ASM_000836 /TAXON_ID=2866 /ORGANISM="Crypthecodinium cohnii, Strain Seligo" /LENGTH=438 /DNA_ID=CAMNT_0053927095 /DNA_START=84 /DNA_END=1400 /DNA_ORIENTATION=+